MKTPILGSTYVLRSPNAADSRMVNLYPEVVPEGGKEAAYLSRAPGIKKLLTLPTGPVRGMWVYNGGAFAVAGNRLYEINSDWSYVDIGPIGGAGPVSMADNGVQLYIACNGPAYIYNCLTNVLGQITDPDFEGAKMVGYLDGYFVYTQPNSQKVWLTSLSDPFSVDPLDYASTEGSPDNLVSLIVDHREVWLFGSNSVEVWYNSGNADFPLTRIQGAFNEIGCIASYSVAKMDNGLFWLGADARGRGMVYRASGYTGQRISTHAVEWQLQKYSTLSDAVAYTYQQDGHSFYVLSFPTANVTWVYDVATQAWHERAGFINGEFTRHRSNCQMSFNNQILVGDYENGNVYAFDLTYYSDNGQTQKWLRSWRALPTGQNDLKRTAQHSLQLDCETGVGLNGKDYFEEPDNILTENNYFLITENGDYLVTDFAAVSGVLPTVMLRWSDDGGHTWSNEHSINMGKIGAYGYRSIWRRLGMTQKIRDRVYEISGTDPIRVNIMGAELLLSGTNA